MENQRGVRRDPLSSSIPTPRFNQGLETLNLLFRTGGTYSLNGLMEYPRYPISELHFRKFLDSLEFSKLESQLQDCSMCKFSVSSNHYALDQRSRDSKMKRLSSDIAVDYRTERFHRQRDA